MGLELFQEHATARAAFDEADAVLNRKLSELCFKGPAEALKQTENTQLAILTCSVAALRVLNEQGNVRRKRLLVIVSESIPPLLRRTCLPSQMR